MSIIAQQRHLATRVIIATQEPTLSPRLLDLCNITIVHRFNSPAWCHTLRKHLAGTSLGEKKNESGLEIFREIVSLKTGEALVFCPKGMLDTITENPDQPIAAKTSLHELQSAYVKMQARKRVTADGGKSIMAVEGSPNQALTYKQEESKFNLSGFGTSPATNGFSKQGLAASFWAPPTPTITQQPLSKPLFETEKPVTETTGLFGSPNAGPAKSFVAPSVPENWQPKTKVFSKPLLETSNPATEKSVSLSLPVGGVFTRVVAPPTPQVTPEPFPTVEKPQVKAEEPKSKVEFEGSNSKVDNWIREVPKPEASATSASRVVEQAGPKPVAPKQLEEDI